MDTYQRSANQYYRPELDVVRFVAFFLVFLCHTLPASQDPGIIADLGGFAPILYASASACSFGLSLFFALSAFLICELLLRECQATGSAKVGQFYVRRILRIWPLYYVSLIIGIIFAYLPGGSRDSAREIGWYFIFMGAWQASHGGIDNPMFVLWSISVEEQFYLLFPWATKYLTRKSLFGICAILILVANGRLWFLHSERVGAFSIWTDSFVQFECFAAGILLCLILRDRVPRIPVWQRLILLAGSWCCWFYASYKLQVPVNIKNDNSEAWQLIAGYALGSLGAIMVLVAFLGLSPRLIPRWAIHMGKISFGLYVFHELVAGMVFSWFPHTSSHHAAMFLLKISIALALTSFLAELSYRFLEMPFLKLKRRHSVIESRPI